MEYSRLKHSKRLKKNLSINALCICSKSYMMPAKAKIVKVSDVRKSRPKRIMKADIKPFTYVQKESTDVPLLKSA
jgi:hypothetical protein